MLAHPAKISKTIVIGSAFLQFFNITFLLASLFEELEFVNKDGFCPHCGKFYEEDKLEKLLSLEKNTDFQCKKCEEWIRGFGEFSFIEANIEYYLVAIKPTSLFM